MKGCGAERFQGKRILGLKDLGFEGCRSKGGHKVKGWVLRLKTFRVKELG